MKHDLKPYPAYKDSGVPPLGKVPEHRQVWRQRNVLQTLVSTIDKHTLGQAHARKRTPSPSLQLRRCL